MYNLYLFYTFGSVSQTNLSNHELYIIARICVEARLIFLWNSWLLLKAECMVAMLEIPTEQLGGVGGNEFHVSWSCGKKLPVPVTGHRPSGTGWALGPGGM